MPYSPEDIVNVELKQAVRGYSIPQVDALLDELADQVEANERDLADLRARMREAEARLASALETESTLKRTLVTAQQAAESALEEARTQADELRSAAEADAERVREEARREAEALVEQARRTAAAEAEASRQQRAAIEARIDALRDLEQRHRRLLSQHLEEQLAVLERFTLPDDDVEPMPTTMPTTPAGLPDDEPTAPEAAPDHASAMTPDRDDDDSEDDVAAGDPPGLRVRVHPPATPSDG